MNPRKNQTGQAVNKPCERYGDADSLNNYLRPRIVSPTMASENLALLQARMRARLPADATGRITYSARANAMKGRVPA
jgi:hypothetical protein